MSRAPNVTFRLEEFGDLSDPPTVERFLRLLNTAMQQTSTALGGGLVVGENVAGFVKTMTFALSDLGVAIGTVTISSGSGTITATIGGNAVAVAWASSDAATAILLAAAVNADAAAAALVVAFAHGGVVWLAARAQGTAGNGITLAVAGTGATRSADTLKGGVDAPRLRMRNGKTGPTAILVGRAEDLGPAAPAAGAIPPDPLPVSLGSVGWAVSKGEIVISALSGLDASRKYRVTFLVLS